MRFPRLSVLFVFLREWASARTLRREPEPALVMDDPEEAGAFDEGGRCDSALSALYVFNAAHATKALQGCQRVLDLGCGPGNQLGRLARLHPDTSFLGVDLSESMLETARSQNKTLHLPNVSYIRGDISELSEIPDASVDGILSTLATHHLPTRKHLDQFFKTVRRVLRPGGAVYLLDFGRLKSLKTVMYFAYRDQGQLPYLCALDLERSLRAAFTLEDYQKAARAHFGDELQVVGTFKTPMMIMVKTPDRPVPSDVLALLRDQRKEIPVRYRGDLDDLRLFFWMSGLSNDPFGSFLPEMNIRAKLRMLRINEFDVQVRLAVRRFARILKLAWMGVHVGIVGAVGFAKQGVLPQSRRDSVRRATRAKIGSVLTQGLGRLKGPVMKLGQMMSYIPVGLPSEITRPLESLQDTVPPLSGAVIRKMIERELKRPISEIFSEWRDVPLASASICQLHYARRMDGRAVVVKVKHPEIDAMVTNDLKNFRLLRPWLKRRTGLVNVDEILEEIQHLMADECDLKKAGDFQEEFRTYFAGDPDIIVPEIFWDMSTKEILTMEYVEGESYTEFKERATAEEKNKAAEIIWRFAATSINRHCLYNADPHPGNYLFVGGKVCFLDYGFTKRFSPQFMRDWKEQSLAACDNDLERFAAANRRLGYVVDESKFGVFPFYCGSKVTPLPL